MRHSPFTGLPPVRRGRLVRLLVFVSPLILFGRHSPVPAEELEQHHAHEHGKVTLNVAVEGAALVVEFEAPAAKVVGFEHAPRTAAERTAVVNAAALLRSGRDLFTVPSEAQCRFERTDLAEPSWRKARKDHEPGGHHESASSHSGHDHARHDETHDHHSDYRACFTYRCAHPAKLAWQEPALLGKLPNLTEARVNLITPAGQRSETVNSARTCIRLGGSRATR